MSVHVSSKPADEASRLPAAAWLVLGIVLVAEIMDLLDSTITTIAAPAISSSLHGGPGLIKWLGASYALALGALLVTGGRLGDKYGRRRTFLIGIAGFTAASLACGLAWDPPSIIVARLVQGAFGALLIPQGFGMLGSVFPREHIGKAFSAFGPILGLSAVGGPLLAGLLIDANLFGLGWRPMFLINIVLGAAGLAAGLRLLPRDAGDRAVSIDALGSALLAACMLGLLFGLIQGSTDGWTAAPVAALAAGVIFFAAFAQRQRTAAAPLIKPSLLRNRGFTAGLILGLVFFAAVAGLLYAVSLFLQRGAGYSPERAAVTGFAPAAAGIVIASVACRNLVTRQGRRLSLAGIVVTVAGMAVLAAVVAHSGTAASTAELAPAMTLIGLGMGATFSTIYDTAIGDIDPAEAGSASGSLSSVQQLANAIGPAVITTIYFGALASGPAHAMTLSLLTVIAIGALSCLAIPLLPRHAQPARPHWTRPVRLAAPLLPPPRLTVRRHHRSAVYPLEISSVLPGPLLWPRTHSGAKGHGKAHWHGAQMTTGHGIARGIRDGRDAIPDRAAGRRARGGPHMVAGRLPDWRRLGFAAADFLITMPLSAADASTYLLENSCAPHFLHGHQFAVTLVLEAIGIAVVLVGVYLMLNAVGGGRRPGPRGHRLGPRDQLVVDAHP